MIFIDFSICLVSGTLSQDQPASSEVITTAVTAKETAEQHHGSDEPVGTSCTDQVFSTNALLSQGNTITFSLGKI